MSRVNVYLPDELAEEARREGLNVSAVTQDALRERLARLRTRAWLERVRRFPPADVAHDQVMEALGAARDELGAPGA